MNWDHIEGNWEQFKTGVQLHWEKLTFSQIENVSGKRDRLSRKIQEVYGISSVTADQQIDTWQEGQNASAYLIERATERNGAPQ
jgi:uncharacterized protein YjbJ (UPF0337 family)